MSSSQSHTLGTAAAAPRLLRGSILIVDDDAANRRTLSRLLTRAGAEVVALADGAVALESLQRSRPDVVLLDIVLPGLDGFEVCRRIKAAADTRLLPVVLLTGLHAKRDRITGIDAGADEFLNKPYDSEELIARVGSLLRLKRYTDDLESAESMILSLALTVEARDPYTEGHCQRLARYATRLGERLGLAGEEVEALHRGGYLHDVGKIGIPDAVLLKSGPLTAAEYEELKQHTIIGDRLLGGLRSLRLVSPIVRHHHERLDGSGYPDGLRGDAIPLLAQIVSVVDTYDAITTDRPYRAALSPEHALRELRDEAARGRMRGDLVELFAESIVARSGTD